MPLFSRIVKRVLEIPKRGLPKLRSTPTTFDDDWNTDTDGLVWLTNPSSPHFADGVRYEACSPYACQWAIEQIPNRERFCFVDVGCGKGRPLLIASRYGFRRLIGVEYSERLCRVARKNLADQAEIVCQDAADFRFPDGPLFVYFHNPFGESVLTSVLSNLHPPCYVAWEGPRSSLISLPVVAEATNVKLFQLA